MIDCRSLTLDTDRLALVVRASRRHRPPLALLVTPDQRAALDAPDGYLDDVPLTTDAAVIPPPKPVPEPEVPPRPFAELRAERKAQLRAEAWARVDEAIDPREQTALLALLARATLAIATGQPVDTEALADLTSALGAVEQILADWPAVEAAVDAATTLAELEAVTVPEPTPVPRVSAAAIAAKLRRG